VVLVNVMLAAALFFVRPPSTPREVPASPVALPAAIVDLRARTSGGHAGEAYALRLDDAELSATAEFFLAEAPDVPFARPRVSVRLGQIVVDAVTRDLAIAIPVRVVGTLTSSGGLPVAAIHDVSLGDVSIPGAIRDQIVAEANRSLDFSRYPMPVTVDTIQLHPGLAVINGHIK
jgi:hypothetical protein